MEQLHSPGGPARGGPPPAGLAYYEIYGSGGGCGAFGRYEGAKLACLKSDADSPVVTRDGYALVLPQGAAGTYRLHYGYSPHTLTIAGDSMRWGSEPVTALEVVQGTGRDARRYRLIPLPDEVMTEPLTSAGPNPDSFYRALEIEPLDCAGRPIYGLSRAFYFNPHFAKTVERGGVQPPERSNTRTRAILIRTARHLYNIARFKSRYVLGYYTAYYFEQELDLDYATYTAYLGAGFPAGVSEAEPYVQDRIGTAHRDRPGGPLDRSYQFKGTYDGGHHGIRNAVGSRGADQDTDSGGLFGLVGQDGILKNLAGQGERNGERGTPCGASEEKASKRERGVHPAGAADVPRLRPGGGHRPGGGGFQRGQGEEQPDGAAEIFEPVLGHPAGGGRDPAGGVHREVPGL